MKEPEWKGDTNDYLKEMCAYADTKKGPNETVTCEVMITLFGGLESKTHIAAIASTPVSAIPRINLAVKNLILDRELQTAKYELDRYKKKVEEYEERFGDLLEDEMVEEYAK